MSQIYGGKCYEEINNSHEKGTNWIGGCIRTESATSAEAELTVLARELVDCIILNLMMTGQTGFDLCKQIRGDSDIPILFLSARGDDVDKIRGLGIGADDYIVKSTCPGEVVARFKAVRRTSSRLPNRQTVLDYGRKDRT